VAITPACGYVGPMGALAVGLLVSPCCILAIEKLKPRLGLDDSFDAFGVHGVGGLVGGVLTTVFALPALGGLGFAEGRSFGTQMLIQVGAMGFSVLFSIATSWIAFRVASVLCGGLRVGQEHEADGLDLGSHGESGYKFNP
jgi:Amt family ammonium transporter